MLVLQESVVLLMTFRATHNGFAVFYQFPDLRKLFTDVENTVFTSRHGSVNDLLLAAFIVFYQFPDLRKLFTDVETANKKTYSKAVT